MQGLLKTGLPQVETGQLAVVKGLISPDDCQLAVHDLTGIRSRIERLPLTFDQRWHPSVPEAQRTGNVAQLLGNSRPFVEAQLARLTFADQLEPMLSSIRPAWRRMTGVVKMLTSGQGKPLGTDGVRDLRVSVVTGTTTLEIGDSANPAFRGLRMPLEAGDGLVVNNVYEPGESQTEYGLQIPPDSAPQAVLHFCMTD